MFITNKLQTEMKNFYLAIVLIALASCTPKEKKFQPDYRGDIASVIVYKYTTNEVFGEVHKDKLDAVYKLDFDDNNNIINKQLYDNNGKLFNNEEIQYNEDNLIVKKTSKDPNGDGAVITYTYDGRLVKESNAEIYILGGLSSSTMSRKYAYENKKIVEIITIDMLNCTTKMHWDNNVCTEITTYPDISLETISICEYNENMQIIRYIADGIVTEIAYNEMGLPIKYTNVSDRHLSDIDINDISRIRLTSGTNDITVDYKYDKYKNWIYKQINYGSAFDRKAIIMERTITYR